MEAGNAFLAVLCSALQHKEVPKLDKSLFRPVLEKADQQHLFGMISEKLAEDAAFCASEGFEWALQKNVCYAMEQKRRDSAFFALYRSMKEEGLQPLVMKGIACRAAYGSLGRLRPSGDEDLLVLPDQFHRASRVLLSMGYTTGRNLETLRPETEHHVVFQKVGGHTVELHVRPMGVENSILQQMDRFFDDAFSRAVSLEVYGETLYTLSPTDHYLLLIFHAVKHFLGKGFGVRLLADVAVFYEAHRQEIALETVMQALKACRMEDLYGDMVFLANRELGFSLPETGKTNCPEVLLQEMLKCGVSGEKSLNSSLAAMVTFSNIRHKSKGKALWRLLFPSREMVLTAHPEWEKKPLRRMLHYPKRWLKAAGLLLRHRDASPLRSLQVSQERLQLIKRYGLQ